MSLYPLPNALDLHFTNVHDTGLIHYFNQSTKTTYPPSNNYHMYLYKNCGSWSIKRKNDYTYHWADFGIVLAETVTNYICKTCRYVLQIIHIVEKKDV